MADVAETGGLRLRGVCRIRTDWSRSLRCQAARAETGRAQVRDAGPKWARSEVWDAGIRWVELAGRRRGRSLEGQGMELILSASMVRIRRVWSRPPYQG
jgi:hypothetical protein